MDGSLVSGQWPTWYSTAGIYGFIATGDLNGDGLADVEVGRDHHFLTVYDTAGNPLPGGQLRLISLMMVQVVITKRKTLDTTLLPR